jgi:YndJ-like protein
MAVAGYYPLVTQPPLISRSASPQAIANRNELQMMNSDSALARRSAAAGFAVWLLLLLAVTADSRHIELIHKVVLFGVLVVVPLGLSLVGGEHGNGRLYRWAVLLQPVAALLTVASFFFAMGIVSALLSSSWLVVNILVALFGLTRFLSRGLYPLEESSIDAGLLYLPVAGAWLVVYRLGEQPFGYGETIILLTVVHFHFAGFATPIIAGMTGRVLAMRQHPRRLFVVSVFAIVAAMPLIAAGITVSPWLGFVGALLLTTGLVSLAILNAGWVLPQVTALSAKLLLSFAALTSCVAMVLACLYAYSLATHTLILDIPQMAMTHGILNAFGFIACSLLAWSFTTRQSPAQPQ